MDKKARFRKAVKGFTPPVVGDWGKWEELDIFKHSSLGVIPPKGLIRCVANDRYIVQFYSHETSWGLVTQLAIRQRNGVPVRSWSDMQQIKNELVGSSALGVQVFPDQLDLVDEANLYHLWILPDGFKLPFGLHYLGWADGIRTQKEN